MLDYAINFGAGLLTAMSPCVLPVLPIIASSALQQHRAAPLAMATGLITSFAFLGIIAGAVGTSLGVSSEVLRVGAAGALIAFGVVQLVPRFQHALERVMAPLAAAADQAASGSNTRSMGGQFLIGALLGIVWSPCVGPTLGAALTLAAQAGGLPKATLLMLLYGLGAATPLVAAAYGLRGVIIRHRGRLASVATRSRTVLASACIVVGALVLAGLDKRVESFLVAALPEGWLDLITVL